MQKAQYPDQQIRQYLLAEMAEPEREAFEAHFFEDDELFARVEEVKGELTDAYVRQRVPTAQAHKLARRLTTSAPQRAELAFAKALLALINENEVREPVPAFTEKRPAFWPTWNWGWVVATLLLLGVGLWLWQQNRSLRGELAALRQQQTQRERDLADQLAQSRATVTTPPISSVAVPSPPPLVSPTENLVKLDLIAGLRSSNDLPTARLKPNTQSLRLQLELSFKPAGGVCQLELFQGDRLVQRQTQARATNVILPWVVPASKFSAGDYIAVLKGKDGGRENQPVTLTYVFRVVRQ